jgi:hypothetical protein
MTANEDKTVRNALYLVGFEVVRMNINWNTELAGQLDWPWQNHFRPRLDGLSDEEYHRDGL